MHMVREESRRKELIDVIIPAHQAEGTLARALKSVHAQSAPIHQIFVVADACTDQTAAIATQLGASVLDVDFRSAGAARNHAIEMSKATWVAFLDADDSWESSWIESVQRRMKEHQTADVYFGRIRECEEANGHSKTVAVSPACDSQGDVFEQLFRANFINTQAVVARRSAILSAGGFAEDIQQAEDLDLWLRMAASCSFHPVSGVHVTKYRYPHSLSRNPLYLDTMRENSLQVIGRAATLRPVSAETFRHAISEMYVQSSLRMLAAGRRCESRADLKKALKIRPGRVDGWAIAGFSILPTGVQENLLAVRSRLRPGLRLNRRKNTDVIEYNE